MKKITEYITERGAAPLESYRVSFIVNNKNIDATILIDINDVKDFEDFINNAEGEIFAHASGKNIYY